MWEDIVGIKKSRMNNKLYFLYVIPTKNLFVVFLFKRMQFLKFNSSINLSFFWSPCNYQPTYIKYFNCSWITKSSHSRVSIFTFLFICSKRIAYLVFVGSGGAFCCLDYNVYTFTYSFIISNLPLLIYLRIPIFSYSLLHPFIYSFIISMWLFLLHLRILISSTSLLLPFNSSFVISALISLLHLHISISYSSLILASLHCGMLALKF